MAEVGGAPSGDDNVDLELQILVCMDALFNFNLAVDELERRELCQQTSRRLLDDMVNSMSDGDRFVLSYPADVEAFQRFRVQYPLRSRHMTTLISKDLPQPRRDYLYQRAVAVGLRDVIVGFHN
ncbi:hypothetical protein CCACVL1_22756 [Corchorus capsularis]|uniref:Uncharacterized protein n=1 Tax=Corchorus capsularis TaxID=210143 RepID=A0A1R3GWQ3_COCAP|nr:hypothetical protein CCACVL1_22756 [Corchorus capsularis]